MQPIHAVNSAMSSFRLRPRFRELSPLSPEDFQARIEKALSEGDPPCMGTLLQGYISLKIKPEERHFWSPQLNLSCEEHQDGTLINGLYGPNPTVWALFAFGYGALGLIGMLILFLGLSRLSLDMPADILWVLPGLGVAAALLYVFAQTGQKIGAEQMFTLHHFFEDVAGHRIPVN